MGWWKIRLIFLETKRNLDGHPISEIQCAKPFKTDWISGCMTLVPRTTFKIVGGYDESFFIWSDEWDLSLRVVERGWDLLVVPRSRIYHKIGKTLGVLKPLSYYYSTRNRLLLKKKHLALHLRVLFFMWFIPTRIVRFSHFLFQGQPDLIYAGLCAIKDYFFRKTGKWDKQVG